MKKLIIPTISLIVAVMFAVGFTFAWFNMADKANDFKFQIAKIDSTVSLFKAVDSNFNGIPNIVTKENDGTQSEEFEFTPIGDPVYAVSPATYVDETLKTEIVNAQPTMIFTFKIILENKGDIDNIIGLSFINYRQEDTAANISQFTDNLKWLSCVSVTVGGEVGEDGELKPFNGHSIEKIFLQDGITTKDGSNYEWNDTIIFGEEDNLTIDGVLSGNNNIAEFWLRYTIEPYEVLQSHAETQGKQPLLTSEEYQALQGKSMLMPLMCVSFQVNS